MNCWVCNRPAVWTVTAKKAVAGATPVVLVEFAACENCIPFALGEKGQKLQGAAQ